jgi:hypothetical protein
MTAPIAPDNLYQALLTRLAHLQPLANFFEGGDWSRDGYRAAHASILAQIDCLIHGYLQICVMLQAQFPP